MKSAARCLQGSGLPSVVGDDPVLYSLLYREAKLGSSAIDRSILCSFFCCVEQFSRKILGTQQSSRLEVPVEFLQVRFLHSSAVRFLFSLVSHPCP